MRVKPLKGVYEATDALVEWMSNTLLTIEQSTFMHFRNAYRLVEIVDAAENGKLPKFAALSAIRAYNYENDTNLDYNSILYLDASGVFSDVGEWVAFTDNPRAIITGPYDEAEDALADTPDSVQIVLVWDTQSGDVFVYKSPHTSYRAQLENTDTAIGRAPGDALTYVLPPQIEASLYSLERGSLLQHAGR